MSDIVILVLGSNLGDRVAHLCTAREGLGEFGEVLAASRIYLSSPFGVRDQPDFLNAALAFETELNPWQLLEKIKELERTQGRNDESQRFGPRVIDIDIALWEHIILDDEFLSIPHRGLPGRDFFLRPILDLSPKVIDPRSGRTLSSFLSRIRFTDLTVKKTIENDRWHSITT